MHGLSYERPLLDRLGPFDASVRVGEDTLAARHLVELGIDGWFEPTACAAHVGPDSTRMLVQEHYARGARRARAEASRLRTVSATRAVFASGVVWLHWLAMRISRSSTNAADQRGRLVVSLPWLALARAAYVAGWYRERVRSSRRHLSSDAPSASAGRSPTPPRATS